MPLRTSCATAFMVRLEKTLRATPGRGTQHVRRIAPEIDQLPHRVVEALRVQAIRPGRILHPVALRFLRGDLVVVRPVPESDSFEIPLRSLRWKTRYWAFVMTVSVVRVESGLVHEARHQRCTDAAMSGWRRSCPACVARRRYTWPGPPTSSSIRPHPSSSSRALPMKASARVASLSPLFHHLELASTLLYFRASHEPRIASSIEPSPSEGLSAGRLTSPRPTSHRCAIHRRGVRRGSWAPDDAELERAFPPLRGVRVRRACMRSSTAELIASSSARFSSMGASGCDSGAPPSHRPRPALGGVSAPRAVRRARDRLDLQSASPRGPPREEFGEANDARVAWCSASAWPPTQVRLHELLSTPRNK